MSIDDSRRAPLARLSTRLGTAWQKCARMDCLVKDEVPLSRAEAYFVADGMAKVIDDEVSGWKVGATSARMRELDSHSDVIPGRIFRSVTWHGNQLSLPANRFPAARAEAEFAFRLTADVTEKEIQDPERMSRIAVLHPAIEIIGNRYIPDGLTAAENSLMTVADNGGGIGFVFGDPVADWHEVDFSNHVVHVSVDGGSPSENFLGDMRGAPLQAICDLGAHLALRGYQLMAGDYVSTGAACVPQAIGAGSELVADFGHLGGITLRFEQ